MTLEAFALWLLTQRPDVAAAYALRFSFQAAAAARYRSEQQHARLDPIARALEARILETLKEGNER